MNEAASARQHYAEALQIAKDEEIYRVSVDVLFGVVQLLVEDGDVAQGVSLLDFVQHHPTSDFEVKRKAKQKRLAIDDQVDPLTTFPTKISDPIAELESIATSLLQGYLNQ